MSLKPFDHYTELGVQFPSKDDFKTFFVYQKGKVILDGVSAQAFIEAAKKHFGEEAERVTAVSGAVTLFKRSGHVVEDDVDEKGFKQAADRYRQAEKDKHEEFKADLFDEHNVAGNPKAELCFSKAWDRGHSSGFASVADEFSELVCLIQ